MIPLALAGRQGPWLMRTPSLLALTALVGWLLIELVSRAVA